MEPQANDRAARERPVDLQRALVAGLIATAVITVTLALSGQNIMKMLGGMLAPGASTGAQYGLGGAVHLAIGLTYGLLYAWLLGPVRRRGRAIKGVLYGAALAGVALAVMPAAGAMMSGGAGNPCGVAAKNPCNPCGGTAQAENPCNPCNSKAAANPCNPCHPKAAANPCNPCHPQSGAANPCGGKTAAANPCGGGAGNPCGGGGGPIAGLLSLLNHVAYGLALALAYGVSRS
jgi:hypothetical protein